MFINDSFLKKKLLILAALAFFFFFFLVVLHKLLLEHMGYISLTRDRTQAPCIRSTES